MYYKSVIVAPMARGNGLQNILTDLGINYCREKGYKYVTLTVHPENRVSRLNFINYGFRPVTQIFKNTDMVRDVMVLKL